MIDDKGGNTFLGKEDELPCGIRTDFHDTIDGVRRKDGKMIGAPAEMDFPSVFAPREEDGRGGRDRRDGRGRGGRGDRGDENGTVDGVLVPNVGRGGRGRGCGRGQGCGRGEGRGVMPPIPNSGPPNLVTDLEVIETDQETRHHARARAFALGLPMPE